MKKKWKSFWLLMSIFCLLTGSITGCGSTGNTQKQSSLSTTEQEVKLEVWSFYDMSAPDVYYESLWNELAEQYGYQVDVKVYSISQIKDKLKIALACHELPDIFFVWGGNYPNSLIDAGACLPVQKYLEQADDRFREMYTCQYADGNNYIIPCLQESYGVTYYNQMLMERMGLQVPANWDELIALVQKVNAYNVQNGTHYAAIGMGDKDSSLGEMLYCTIANRIDPDAYAKLMSGEIDFTDPAFTEAAQKIEQLKTMGAFSDDYMDTGEMEAVENFCGGEYVLFPEQSSILSYLMQTMGENRFGVVSFPDCSANGDLNYAKNLLAMNRTLTPGMCISTTTEYPDEAGRLCVKYAQEVNRRNVNQYGMFDMTDRGYQIQIELGLPVREFRALVEQADNIQGFSSAVLPGEQGDEFRNLTKKLYAGDLDVQSFIDMGTACLEKEDAGSGLKGNDDDGDKR